MSSINNLLLFLPFFKPNVCPPRRYGMNGRYQMQGDKNWIFPKEINANLFF
jgi:hypothetical protein